MLHSGLPLLQACPPRLSPPRQRGSGAEWKALWGAPELASFGKGESGRDNRQGDVGSGEPLDQRCRRARQWLEKGEKEQKPRAAAGRREGRYDACIYGQVETQVANLALHLSGDTCRLRTRAHSLFSPTSVPLFLSLPPLF